jgi:hypothetical protein
VIERIAARSESEARQPQLCAVHRSSAQPSHGDSSPTQRDLASRRSRALRSAPRIRHALRTAQRSAVLLHHRRQHLAACRHAQREESLPHILQAREQTQRNLHLDKLLLTDPLAIGPFCETLSHGGSFLWFGDPVLPDGDWNRHFFTSSIQQNLGHPPLSPDG